MRIDSMNLGGENSWKVLTHFIWAEDTHIFNNGWDQIRKSIVGPTKKQSDGSITKVKYIKQKYSFKLKTKRNLLDNQRNQLWIFQ